SRHSAALAAWKSASRNSHSMAAGAAISKSQATRMVSKALSGVAKSPSANRSGSGYRAEAGGDGTILSAMSALHQGDAPVVPVHQNRNGQADRKVSGHDDQDVFYGLSRLVQGGIGDGNDVRVADSHCERTVLGQVKVLAGHGRHDDSQRLRQHDQPQYLGRGQPQRTTGLPLAS